MTRPTSLLLDLPELQPYVRNEFLRAVTSLNPAGRLPTMGETIDAVIETPTMKRLLAAQEALDAIRRMHVPAHAYCAVCDVHLDVEHQGNNPTCVHYSSYCRNCEFAWPCPTAEEFLSV